MYINHRRKALRHESSEVFLNWNGRIGERRLWVLAVLVQATWEDTKAQVPRRRKGGKGTRIHCSGDTLLEVCKVEVCDANFAVMTVAIARVRVKSAIDGVSKQDFRNWKTE